MEAFHSSLFSLSEHDKTEATRKVIVLGDVMLDRYWYGNTSRISPEAPVPVVHVDDEEARPGGAANVALNLKHLGADVVLVGVVGNDDNADTLRYQLEQAGIICAFVTADNIRTITKLRIMAQNQQLIRTDFEHTQMTSQSIQPLLLAHVQAHLADAHALVLSDYGKGCLRPAAPFIKAAQSHKIPVIVDPKGTDWQLYSGSTIITPNSKEFIQVAGACDSQNDLVKKAQQFISELNLQALLVTRGAEGMSLIQKDGQQLHIPTQAREVFDVTGAGDTVIATLALCLAHELPFKQAVPVANVAAGLVVAKLGTATVSRQELAYALAQHTPVPPSGVISVKALCGIRHRMRQQNKTVVMTNGCFDLLHPGHLQYLQAARELGDCLIVAVNDDHSIRRLKGEARPINPLHDRMQHLAALGCVDWVVPFSDDTPQALIEAILPDILIKGGDYTPSQVAGGQAVIDNGGRVEILPFKSGYSTTQLIERIKASEPAQLA